jgi:hypothetical protein
MAQTPKGAAAPESPTALFRATLDLSNEVDNVRDGLRAYRALADLVTPWHIVEPLGTENLDMVRRDELAALLDVLNTAMADRIDKASALADAVHELEIERSQA